MYCQNCGIENESNAEYCKSCGQPLNVTQDVQPSKNKKKIPKALIWIPLATVFLVAIGVFGYRHFSGGRQTYEPCTVIAYQGEKMLWKETWNKYGDPEEGCYYSEDGENEYIEWKNEYDSKGRMIREEYNSSNQNSFYTVYEYTGNTMEGKRYIDGEMTEIIKGTLNDKGLPTQIEYFDPEGNLYVTTTIEYDDHGYITRQVREYDGKYKEFSHDSTSVREYTYEQGHPVSAEFTFTEYYEDEDEEDTVRSMTWEFVY